MPDECPAPRLRGWGGQPASELRASPKSPSGLPGVTKRGILGYALSVASEVACGGEPARHAWFPPHHKFRQG